MMEVAALLRYWRNSLADADLRSPVTVESFEISLSEIHAGRIGGQAEKIFAAAEKTRRKEPRNEPGKKSKEPPLEWAPILIAPFGLKSQFQHGKAVFGKGRVHYPLWIPAEMDRSGNLQASASYLPWMVREHLEPVPRDTSVITGKLEDFDGFLTSEEAPPKGDWKATVRFADRMLQRVMSCGIANAELEDAQVLPPIAVVWIEDRGMSRSLVVLYDELLVTGETPALLRRLATGASASPAPEPYALASGGPSLRHQGQMGRSFPLSPSQRQALHAFLSLTREDLVAVNGPPGTGKTTLLQSVVASLWVEAALARGEPPIILACSSNNRAVTNILDSFASVATSPDGDPLAERWLPEVESYGLYIPSGFKLEESPYQKAAPGYPSWRGLPEVMENAEYVTDAEERYLTRARAAFPGEEVGTVEEAVARLHDLLSKAWQEAEKQIAQASEIRSLRRQHGHTGDATGILPRLRRDRETLELTAAEEKALYNEVLQELAKVSFWEDLLAQFLSSIRERRNRKVLMPYLRRHREPPVPSGNDLARALPSLLAQTLKEAEARLDEIRHWEEQETRFSEPLSSAAAGRETLPGLRAAALNDPEKIEDLLDCGSRHRLFLLAGRYWEGRWLLTMKGLLAAGHNFGKQSRSLCEARLRRFSMLTPCMVATFYQAPKIVEYFDPERSRPAPMLETIDLLIVDEAGQVSPEVGAAVFALARRALVVGDVHQIEPVWGVPPALDAINLRSFGLPHGAPDSEDVIAHRASLGSVMLLARRATAKTCEDDRGLFLREHRRSVPEVIRYCNELVYKGRLQPLRPAKKDRVLPPLGWAHIGSESGSERGSRINRGQASAIASWLESRRQELEDHYAQPLSKIVAVITPFSAQSQVLREELQKRKLTLDTGTVHTFQGGELPVVLFSPVYSTRSQPPSKLFFDAGPNLLNVAVSRARDSFLVFGDMGIFSARSSHPSSALSRLLFESPDHEITDVEAAPGLAGEKTRRIATLPEHREVLRKALSESQERVLIVSPFLSMAALQEDEVAARIAESKRRNVHVCVVYSTDLNTGSRERSASAAAETLRRSGAHVIASTRIHSKTLAVDDGWIAEGSFNWLSARRDEGHPFQRYESSLCCEGPDAPRFIESAWKEIVALR